MQEKFPAYKDNFLPWADHSNAMHQYFRMFTLFFLRFTSSPILTITSLDRS